MEVVPILAISIILYCLCEILKGTVLKNNEDFKAVLPYTCAILGAIFAVIVFCFNPDLIGAKNILDAIVEGAISGLVATGSHQLYKQFSSLMALRAKAVTNEETPDEKEEETQDEEHPETSD